MIRVKGPYIALLFILIIQISDFFFQTAPYILDNPVHFNLIYCICKRACIDEREYHKKLPDTTQVKRLLSYCTHIFGLLLQHAVLLLYPPICVSHKLLKIDLRYRLGPPKAQSAFSICHAFKDTSQTNNFSVSLKYVAWVGVLKEWCYLCY